MPRAKQMPKRRAKTTPALRLIEGIFKQIEKCLEKVKAEWKEEHHQKVIYGCLHCFLHSEENKAKVKLLYWDRQEGTFKENTHETMPLDETRARPRPDFVILGKYRIVIEYKKGGRQTWQDLQKQCKKLAKLQRPRKGFMFDFVLGICYDTTDAGSAHSDFLEPETETALKNLKRDRNIFLTVVRR